MARFRSIVVAASLTLSFGVAHAQRPTAPDLTVHILRSGPDHRPLLAPGQTATISIGLDTRRGEADADTVFLTVQLPAGLTLLNADPIPPTTGAAGHLGWDIGTIEARGFP